MDDDVRRLLTHARTWVVVGLGGDPAREAYGVARWLQTQGRRVVPVHPRGREVLGEPGFACVTDAVAALRAQHATVEVVDFFVNSRRVGPLVDEAVAAGVPTIWLQLGVDDPPAVARARAAGVVAVVDACPRIEWARHRLSHDDLTFPARPATPGTGS